MRIDKGMGRFYDKEKELYKLDNHAKNYSVLGNAFVLLIGLGDKALAEKIIEEVTFFEPKTD